MSLKNIYLGFKFSLSYFSILPVKFKVSDDLTQKEILLWMLLSFPLVGFIISSLAVALIYKSSLYLYLLSAVLYVVLYGFLHTEAVIDVVDAIFAKHSKKDSYQVIKEPTVGAMGVLWGVTLLILKLATLVYLLYLYEPLYLIAVAVASRVGALIIFYLFEFKSTFLTILKSAISKQSLIFVIVFYTILEYLLLSINGVFILSLAIVLSLLTVKILKKMVGFINGDVVGTTIESVELLVMIILVLGVDGGL